jgi:pimeloyl-ACP methyl ester carboxylesterase
MDGVHLIEGAGHWVQQEQPERFNAILLEFLRRHPVPR